jgi:hypothetical protein
VSTTRAGWALRRRNACNVVLNGNCQKYSRITLAQRRRNCESGVCTRKGYHCATRFVRRGATGRLRCFFLGLINGLEFRRSSSANHLSAICLWRSGHLGATRAVDGGSVRHQRVHDALAEMACNIRSAAGGGRRAWLVQLGIPQALFLIPLTRFPGFIWMVATGLLLPKTTARRAAAFSH